jgi:hypothetical protein
MKLNLSWRETQLIIMPMCRSTQNGQTRWQLNGVSPGDSKSFFEGCLSQKLFSHHERNEVISFINCLVAKLLAMPVASLFKQPHRMFFVQPVVRQVLLIK